MAKSILINILSGLLGKYIDGLVEDNLIIGVWDGEVELQNIELKKSALDDLHLPIKVTRGHVGKIIINIPWTSLNTNPVRLRIDDILLQAEPLDISSMSSEELKEHLLFGKQKKLNEIEESVLNKNNNTDNIEEKSIVQKFVEKIIDNLEISINNFHLRFENSADSSRVNKYSIGLTLSSFLVITTDENGIEQNFVDRDKSNNIIHKSILLDKLSVYCNTNDMGSNDMNFEEWKSFMLNIISEQENSYLNCILFPNNKIKIKLVNDVYKIQNCARYSISIHQENIFFKISNGQLRAILEILRRFSILDRQILLAIYRPRCRPTESPLDWWKYALTLIAGRKVSSRDHFDEIQRSILLRKRYIILIMNRHELKDSNNIANLNLLNKEIDDIEYILPFTTLKIFREEAAYNIIELIENKKIIEITQRKENERKWNLFWYSMGLAHLVVDGDVSYIPNESTEDGVLLEYEKDLMSVPVNNSDSKQQQDCYISVDFPFETSIVLEIGSIKHFEINLSFKSSLKLAENDVGLSFDLLYLNIKDNVVSNNEPYYILKSESIKELNNSIETVGNFAGCKFSYIKERIGISIQINESELNLNFLSVTSLIDFLTPNTENSVAISDNFDPHFHSLAALYMEINKESLFELSLDAKAPKVIISNLKSNLDLVFDIGLFNTYGSNSSGSFLLDASLRGFDAFIVERYPQAKATTSKIIEKFDIEIKLVVQEYLLININILQNLSLFLSPRSLSHIFGFISLILKIINSKSNKTIVLKKTQNLEEASNDDIFVSINPNKPQIIISFLINGIDFNFFDVQRPSSQIKICFDHLSGNFTQKSFAKSLKVLLESVFLENQFDKVKSRKVITSMNHKSFIDFTILIIDNKLSKEFNGFGVEILMFISGLKVFLENNILHIIEPYMTIVYNWLAQQEKSNDILKIPFHDDNFSEKLIIPKSFTDKLKLSVSVDDIALSILHTVYENSDRDKILKSEPMFEILINKIKFDLEINEFLLLKLIIGAVNLFDIRSIAMESKFKRLLGKSQYSDEENSMINLIFEEKNEIEKDCSIIISGISNYTNLDSILDLIDLILNVLDTLQETVVPKAEYKSTLQDAPKEKLSWITSSYMNLSVEIFRSEFLFLDDLTSNQSAALKTEFSGLTTTVQIVTKKYQNNSIEDHLKISICLNNLNLILLKSVNELSNILILEPTSVFSNLLIYKNLDEVPTNSVFLKVNDPVKLNLSLMNIELLLSILAKRTDPRKRVLQLKNNLDNSDLDNEDTTYLKLEKIVFNDIYARNKTAKLYIQIKYSKFKEFTSIRSSNEQVYSWDQINYIFEINQNINESVLFTFEVYELNVDLVDSLIGESFFSYLNFDIEQNMYSINVLDTYGRVCGSLDLILSACKNETSTRINPINDLTCDIPGIYLSFSNDIHGEKQDFLNFELEELLLSTKYLKNVSPTQTPYFYTFKFDIFLEYFRVDKACWEPIIEHSSFEINVSFQNADLDIVLKSTSLVQFNVSDVCLKSLLSVYNSWILSKNNLIINPDFKLIVLESFLGLEFVVKDNCSGFELGKFSGENFERIPIKFPDESSKKTNVIKKIDLIFQGEDSNISNIIGLPVFITKSYSYNWEYESIQDSYQEPIQEIIYENQIYDPLYGWIISSPGWVDVNGCISSSKEDFMVSTEGWYWADSGSIDMTGVGVEVDSDGWEYSSSLFTTLGRDAPRRLQGPMDSVRRRRWICTKVPQNNKAFIPQDKRKIFWDVHFDKYGSRILQLKTYIQVQNNLPFPIFIQLFESSSIFYPEIGPINEESSISVPVYNLNAKYIRFKHADMKSFSKSYKIKSKDTRHVSLLNESGSIGKSLNFEFSSCLKDSNNTLIFNCRPYVSILNYLPYDVSFILSSKSFTQESNEQSNTPSKYEYVISERGSILSGLKRKLLGIHKTDISSISFAIPDSFEWSDLIHIKDPTRIGCILGESSKIIKFKQLDSNKNIATVMMKSTVNEYGTVEIKLFSKYAIIDKSGLQISVRSYLGNDYFDQTINSLLLSESNSIEVADPITITLIKAPSDLYVIDKANIQSTVYTDEQYRWTHLPYVLDGLVMLKCPNCDAFQSEKGLLVFKTNANFVLFVLIDTNNELFMEQLIQDGFKKIQKYAFANHNEKSIKFTILAKICNFNDLISIDGSDTIFNNIAIIVGKCSHRGGMGDIVNELSYSEAIGVSDAKRSWAEGKCGIVMANSENDILSFGVLNEIWSEKINVSGIGIDKRPFDIKINNSKESREVSYGLNKKLKYELAFTVNPWPGVFNETNLIKIIARYCMCNSMNYSIQIRQQDSGFHTSVRPFSFQPWYPEESLTSEHIQIKIEGFEWSLGSIDINELGTTELLVNDANNNFKVVHVEVKLASSDEDCYISVIIWESTSDNSPMKIINHTEETIIIKQLYQLNDNLKIGKFENSKRRSVKSEKIKTNNLTESCSEQIIKILPKNYSIFGWTYPNLESKHLKIFFDQDDDNVFSDNLYFNKFGEKVKIIKNNTEISAIVEASTTGMLLNIYYSKSKSLGSAQSPTKSPKVLKLIEDSHTNSDKMIPKLMIRLSLELVGLSIIVEKPSRREVFNILLSFIELYYKEDNLKTYEFQIRDIQIDNYIESTIFPVLLKNVRDIDNKTFPIIRITAIQDPKSILNYFHLVEIIILELSVEIDSGSIFIFFADFISQFKSFSSEIDYIATYYPQEWINLYNYKIMNPKNRAKILDPYYIKEKLISSKVYLRELILHPIEVTLGFNQTSFDRSVSSTRALIDKYDFLDKIKLIVDFDGVSVKLSSFKSSDILDSIESLIARISTKLISDILNQLLPLAGNLLTNLDMFGRPAGLVKNFGSGIKNFFYQPIKGAMESPYGLFKGLRLGTTTLVTGVVSSTLDSATTIVETATANFVEGATFITGDKELLRSQQKRRYNKAHAKRGLIEGFREGGGYFVSGIRDGMTGLISKPIEGGKRGGIVGFLGGIGSGVVGGIIKPVIGISSGVTTIADGISQQVSSSGRNFNYRPKRTFLVSAIDSNDLILSHLDIHGAYIQQFILKLAQQIDKFDTFLDYRYYSHESAVVITGSFLYILDVHKNGKKITVTKSFDWKTVSHFQAKDNFQIDFILESVKQNPIFSIMCTDKEVFLEVYETLYNFKSKFNTVRNILSLDEIISHS